MEPLKEADSNTIQMLYGFALCAIAVIMSLWFVGNVLVITAAVALLLVKDGLPNFIIGVKNVAEAKK